MKFPKLVISLSSQIGQLKKKFNTVKKGKETTESANFNLSIKKPVKLTLSSPKKLEKSSNALSFKDGK